MDCNTKFVLRTKLCKGVFPPKIEEVETPIPLSAHLAKANVELTSSARRQSIIPEGIKSFTSSAEIAQKVQRLKVQKTIDLGNNFLIEDALKPDDNIDSKSVAKSMKYNHNDIDLSDSEF